MIATGQLHAAGPLLLAGLLAGLGIYGLLARRNLVMMLVGAELLLNAGNLVLVSVDAGRSGAGGGGTGLHDGQVLTLFTVTVAAAEIGLALAVVLLLFRTAHTSDVRAARTLGDAARPVDDRLTR